MTISGEGIDSLCFLVLFLREDFVSLLKSYTNIMLFMMVKQLLHLCVSLTVVNFMQIWEVYLISR
jgi:hypothetical protein